ncbi:hypothetical protein AURDEDRAFT_129380 [Auricularia subglabra TFB-10046 SS5]|nr:hypothetical protein AURDEDRAFT_129380 [Auricularia subglabra TFB-10046 SS5]
MAQHTPMQGVQNDRKAVVDDDVIVISSDEEDSSAQPSPTPSKQIGAPGVKEDIRAPGLRKATNGGQDAFATSARKRAYAALNTIDVEALIRQRDAAVEASLHDRAKRVNADRRAAKAKDCPRCNTEIGSSPVQAFDMHTLINVIFASKGVDARPRSVKRVLLKWRERRAAFEKAELEYESSIAAPEAFGGSVATNPNIASSVRIDIAVPVNFPIDANVDANIFAATDRSVPTAVDVDVDGASAD